VVVVRVIRGQTVSQSDYDSPSSPCTAHNCCNLRRPFCAFVARYNLYYYYVPFQSVRRRTYDTVNTMKTVLLYVCSALAVAASGVFSLSVYTDDDRSRVPQPFADRLADVSLDHGSSAYGSRTKRESLSPSILPGVSDGNITSKVSVCKHCYRYPPTA